MHCPFVGKGQALPGVSQALHLQQPLPSLPLPTGCVPCMHAHGQMLVARCWCLWPQSEVAQWSAVVAGMMEDGTLAALQVHAAACRAQSGLRLAHNCVCCRRSGVAPLPGRLAVVSHLTHIGVRGAVPAYL